MSSIRLSGSSSGYYDLTVPAAAGTNSIDLSNLPVKDSNGNLGIGTNSPANFGGQTIQVNHASSYSSVLATSGSYSMQFMASQNNGVMNMGARSNHHVSITTNDTPRLTIDSSGRVTMPYQVAFSAYQTASYGTTAGATLTWSATHVNRGNCFNTSNGTFTAPVAGAYCFQFYQLTQNNTSTGDVRININGTAVDGHYGYGGNQTGHKQSTLSCVLQLSVNDAVKITSIGSNDWNDRHGGFSGFLIG